MNRLAFLITVLLWPLYGLMAQDAYPMVNPSALFVTVEGEEIDDASMSQNAPLVAHFYANPEDVGNFTARYEWIITHHTDKDSEVIVHRFDQDLDYTFTQSGSFSVQLYATFVLGTDTISYPEEGEENPIMVSISESKLEFPNAFSPNGDGYNDVYRAKDGYQSIVQFQATVFSRWGQKIYSWDTLDGGWDGKWNGSTVKDGVYFVQVEAKGADGKKYNLRKTVNVLTGYERNSKESE